MELKRDEVSSIYYEKRKKFNIELNAQVAAFLNELAVDLNKYEYLSNNDFIFDGRKKFIYEEIFNILEGKQNESNPVYFVLGSLEEFISNNNHISMGEYDGHYFAEIRDKNDRYISTGVICLEEKNILIT